MMKGGKRLAVLAGCNYPTQPTRYHLKGCINDVISMKQVLLSRFGFKEEDIELLTDEPGSSNIMPTGANIKSALKRMVERAEEADVLVFHFSGHGTLVPSLKPHEPERKDEVIIPTDLNYITDMDFRQLVNELHPRATFTIMSDSCHSGGLIDQEKEQIGPSTMPPNAGTPRTSRTKFIPIEVILEELKQLTGLDTPNIGTHMTQLFKDEASLSFRLSEADQDKIRAIRAEKGDYGVLLSGCQSDEVSGEDDDGPEKPHGVFSYAILNVLDRVELSERLSNKQAVMYVREFLKSQGNTYQHPCLYCSDENADAVFLLQPNTTTT